MKNFLMASTFAAALVMASTSAFAVSCSQQGQECKAWAGGQGSAAPSFVAKCATEVKACINRCKGGSKYFLGVSVGNQYPITDCK